MRKNILTLLGILLCLAFVLADTNNAAAQARQQTITTNKDKLLTLAVQGEIAPAEPERSYTTTWDGKPKMAIGIGGIFVLKVLARNEPKGNSRPLMKETLSLPRRFENGCSESA